MTVTAGQTTARIDAELVPNAGSMSGTVTNRNGKPLADICVDAQNSNGSVVASVRTRADGRYEINPLRIDSRPGYRVFFHNCGPGNHAAEYFADKHSLADATPVPVTLDTNTPNVNAKLEPGGSISGRVKGSSNRGLEGVCVTAYDPAFVEHTPEMSQGSPSSTRPPRPMPAGATSCRGVASARYKVAFDGDCSGPADEYYNDEPRFTDADLVTVKAPATTKHIDATLGGG